MTETVTKTLQATFAPPTKHKERKLRDTLGTYRDALSDAFEAGASTMSAVNEIVTPYDLTCHAKNALKRYVPQLQDTYDANELDDSHPVRFTSQGWKLDYDESRAHGFCCQIPQAGYGPNVWLPLRINPAQESLWFDVLDGTADTGQFRLQERRKSWELHVTVEYETDSAEYDSSDSDATYIGLDIGESALITGCALESGSPTNPFVCNGSRARHLRKEMHTTLKRLQERDASE